MMARFVPLTSIALAFGDDGPDPLCLRSCLAGEDPVFRAGLTYDECLDQKCLQKDWSVPSWQPCLRFNPDAADSSKISVWRCDDEKEQPRMQWVIEDNGSNDQWEISNIRNPDTSLCLAPTNDEQGVRMQPCDDAKKWLVERGRWGVEIRSLKSNKTMYFDAFASGEEYNAGFGWHGGVSLVQDVPNAEKWQKWFYGDGQLELDRPENKQIDLTFHDDHEQGIEPPSNVGDWAQWILTMSKWRDHQLQDQNVGSDFSHYESERTKKSSATYVTVQTMIHDANLYDPVKNEWTASKYLNDLKERFGGVDQVLIWAGYPNVGVDTRSNFDLMEDLPGGTKGAVQALKTADPNIMVQLPYKPWDIATNGLGQGDAAKMAKLLKDSGADGINMDTMSSATDSVQHRPLDILPEFFDAAEEAGVHDITIEPEKALDGTYLLNVTNQGWTYSLQNKQNGLYNAFFSPPVSSQKMLQRRSMPHVCGRWSKQRSEEILTAFFNGVGYTAWENIWGIWNGVHERDGELLRRATSILRHFHPLLSDPTVAWLPHYPVKGRGDVFASKFVGEDKELLLLISSAGSEPAAAVEFYMPTVEDHDFYDVYRGELLNHSIDHTHSCMVKSCPDSEVVNIKVENRGIGAVLRVRRGELDDADKEFMARMRKLTDRQLNEFNGEWGGVTKQALVGVPAELPRTTNTTGMIHIQGTQSYEFRIRGTMIEGFVDDNGKQTVWEGADVQYPWESVPTKYHEPHVLTMSNFFIDKYPVTNLGFDKFLRDSSYAPADSGHFLRHWGGDGCTGSEDCKLSDDIKMQPVVNVGLDDARAYCAHTGKRLPREWEWQYAAQGGDSHRSYPWGSDWNPDVMPTTHGEASTYEMSNIGLFPAGASKDGVEDLLGLIYHWTDEYADPHTRKAVLRGAPAFQPQGSEKARYQPWYFPGLDWATATGPLEGDPWDPPYTVADKNYASLFNLTAHGNYLLMTPSLDRAGTIGFRCVSEADEKVELV